MNMKKIGAAILVGAMVAGCGSNGTKDEPVLTVNGETLMRSAINADVDAILAAQGDKIPEDQKEYYKQMVRNQLAQTFVFENVLVKKAKAEGYMVTDADRKEREDQLLKALSASPNAAKTVEEHFKKFPLGEARARRDFVNGILIDKMIKDIHAKKTSGADYAAKAQEIVDGVISNNAAASSAAAAAEAKIKSLKEQLDKIPAAEIQAKFAELAKANSACPSSAKGGDLGEFSHGQMVPEFDEVAFKLPVDKVSDPVKTQFGYHLILVTKKTPAVAASGDKPESPERVRASHILVRSGDVRPVPKKEDVINNLRKDDERKFVSEFVQSELKKAKIVAHADDFKQFVPASEDASAEKKAEDVEKKAEGDGKKAEPVEKSAAK